MTVELSIHQQNIVALGYSSLDVGILRRRVGCVDVHHVSILIGLRRLNQRAVFLKREVALLGICKKKELHCGIAELLICQHTILDEYAYVIPFLLKVRTVSLEYIFKTRCNLLGDIAGYLLHGCIALQV